MTEPVPPGPGGLLPDARTGSPGDESAVVSVRPGTERVVARAGESILEALYAAGLAYRTGCRRGGCGVCKADLRTGSVTYRKAVAPQVMTPEEFTDGTCLTCLAVPDGDLEIELREQRVVVRHRFLFDLRRRPPES